MGKEILTFGNIDSEKKKKKKNYHHKTPIFGENVYIEKVLVSNKILKKCVWKNW